jgi:hypothetical protein
MPRDPVIAYHQHQIGDRLTQAAPPGPGRIGPSGRDESGPCMT